MRHTSWTISAVFAISDRIAVSEHWISRMSFHRLSHLDLDPSLDFSVVPLNVFWKIIVLLSIVLMNICLIHYFVEHLSHLFLSLLLIQLLLTSPCSFFSVCFPHLMFRVPHVSFLIYYLSYLACFQYTSLKWKKQMDFHDSFSFFTTLIWDPIIFRCPCHSFSPRRSYFFSPFSDPRAWKTNDPTIPSTSSRSVSSMSKVNHSNFLIDVSIFRSKCGRK